MTECTTAVDWPPWVPEPQFPWDRVGEVRPNYPPSEICSWIECFEAFAEVVVESRGSFVPVTDGDVSSS